MRRQKNLMDLAKRQRQIVEAVYRLLKKYLRGPKCWPK